MQKIVLVIITLCFIASVVKSQDNDVITEPSQITSRNLYKAIAFTSVYYTGSLFVLSKTWYKDKKVTPFHFYNNNKGYLQVDKFGHIYGSYIYSYTGYHYLLNSGFTRKEALLFGSTLGLVLQTPIEIMDGIHEGYVFSWDDMTANSIGSILVLRQEILFNEQIIKYKFSYSQSTYSDKANGYLGKTGIDRLLKDYNGVEIPNTKRYRQYLLSLDIDWTKIETKSKFLQTTFKVMTFIKLPFPALEYNTTGKFKGYWLFY